MDFEQYEVNTIRICLWVILGASITFGIILGWAFAIASSIGGLSMLFGIEGKRVFRAIHRIRAE